MVQFPRDFYEAILLLCIMAPKVAKKSLQHVNPSENVEGAMVAEKCKTTWIAKETETLVNEFIARKASRIRFIVCFLFHEMLSY